MESPHVPSIGVADELSALGTGGVCIAWLRLTMLEARLTPALKGRTGRSDHTVQLPSRCRLVAPAGRAFGRTGSRKERP
eukprot:2995235-Prymnesium_polylepis.1